MQVNTTFEEYLRSQSETAVNGFKLQPQMVDGQLRFLIHPDSVNGETLDFSVSGNQLDCVTQALEPNDSSEQAG